MRTLRNIPILALAFALLAQGSARAQSVSGKEGQNLYSQSSIRARGRGRKLVLVSRGKSHLLDDVSVLFETRRADFTYLLVAACGPSKLKSDDRQCGAGMECNLLWLKLTSGWQIGEIKSVRYESCWSPITSTDGYQISGNTLRMEYSDFRKMMSYKLTYDAAQPEKGFQVEESPLPATRVPSSGLTGAF
jgi:hypothetical protein